MSAINTKPVQTSTKPQRFAAPPYVVRCDLPDIRPEVAVINGEPCLTYPQTVMFLIGAGEEDASPLARAVEEIATAVVRTGFSDGKRLELRADDNTTLCIKARALLAWLAGDVPAAQIPDAPTHREVLRMLCKLRDAVHAARGPAN